MNKSAITGKFIVNGKIKLTSPLMIGSGDKDDIVDNIVLKNSKGEPFIPATSLVGTMRHYFVDNENNFVNQINIKYDKFKKQKNYFWGFHEENSNDSGAQSALFVGDLTNTSKYYITVRDGIKIDNIMGIAKENHKYDYEIVEAGAEFKLNIEINLRKEYCKDTFMKIISFLLQAMNQEKIMLGAKTSRGFGRFKLVDCEFYYLDFSYKEHVISWLSRCYEKIKTFDILNYYNFPFKNNDLLIKGEFNIKNSLLIGSYSKDVEGPDVMHISTSEGKPILPGTSLAGTLRNRGEAIINTLSNKNTNIIDDLFGWIDDKNNKKYKSRVLVKETEIDITDNETKDYYVQNRIKIDRFTGGTIKGALFNEKAIWAKDYKPIIPIDITIKECKPSEVGLFLLIIKDLWNEDLPIGGGKNIGRGVLEGKKVTINYKDDKLIIDKVKGGIKIEGKKEIFEDYVQNLLNVFKGKEDFNE